MSNQTDHSGQSGTDPGKTDETDQTGPDPDKYDQTDEFAVLLTGSHLTSQGLMSLPDPADPVDTLVAAQARDNPDTFAAIARHWTWAYASPTQPEAGLEDGVRRVQAALGLPEGEARERLARADWCVEGVIAEGRQDGQDGL